MEEGNSPLSEEEIMDNTPAVDDGVELEDPDFGVELTPQGFEDIAGLGRCCSVKEQKQNAEKMKKTTADDKIQAFHLRKSLNLLDKLHEEKDIFIQKTREELRVCHQRMDLLNKQQESLATEISREREANNTAAAGRLQAASRRLQTELENERDLKSKITAMLKESENAMWHIVLQRGQFEDVRKHNEEEAEARQRCLEVHAAQQLHKEKEALEKAERNRLLRARKSLHVQRELGMRHQKLVEDAQRNHKVAVKFLKASLGRVRERKQKEEMESREHMKRRMDAVLALKNNITASRETLKKFQAWGQARAELAEQKALAEKEVILAQGGDAFKHLFHQRRHQELEAQRRAFEEDQKLRKQEIISRILKEEAEEETRKKRQHPPSKSTERWTLRDKTWRYISDFCEGKTVPVVTDHLLESEMTVQPKPSRLLKAISSESVQGDLGPINTEEEILAEPEIPGLWSEEYKPYQVPKEDPDHKPVGGTKMDKDILARTVERLRSGVIHKQVVSGREFKGRPFNSKPELIHFKDFDIGKVYKKKITLINATYTINYCKLVGVEESLKDFIHIDFDPPGPMSAGMSCEVLVTFKPMINKDLEGNVSFLAQTGGFSVPLKCSTKKCSLSLDRELIDFGSYVVGETTSRTITLTNVGGLGTKFKFLLDSEFYEMDETLSAVKISSLFTYEDKSVYDKIIASLSEHQLDGNGSSLLDIQSRKESEKLDEGDGTTVASAVTMIPSEEQAEITLGEVTEGDIGPFSSIKVPIIFAPVVPGEVQTKFKVMFKNPQCPTLYFRAVGVALDVPVWVPRATVDLKICMYDRLYQDSILVHTRSKAALRLKFEVCKELRGHIELLPETGYIQALSSYSVQLKFLPRHSLPEDARKYFDKDSRVLEAPMTIWVADQIKPVGFTVQAIVTTSDLEICPPEIDFGYCTIYEAIRTEISLSNLSLLPQEFGFVGLPKFVDIQPNDGFGTILPLETLQFDIIFQPTKAKEYRFELTCKSEINRPHNTLYLELWCPAVAPSIVVTSNKGKTIFNFGDIAVGHRSIKKISLQNISHEDLYMEFSVLNPNGPFVLLNPSRKLCSGDTQILVLSFSPHESILAQETLDIITKRGTLTLTLTGTGVASMITCSIEGNVLNMGYVLARESVTANFKLHNESSLPIKFWMRLESLSGKRAEARQQLPQFLTSLERRTEVVGTQNYNGQSVFSVFPVEGLMFPGKVQEFTVTFSPDHESLFFSDQLQVVLFEKRLSHQILLKGAAREHMMFVEGGDPLDVPVESLTVIPAFDPEHREDEPSPKAEELKPILVTLNYVQFDTDLPNIPATRELQVGCIRTTQPSPRKTVEFSLDSIAWLQHKGFSIEPSRGSVDRGQTKTINISWVPPADFDPDHPFMVSALLQLRGDVKETYKVIFVAHVVAGL